MTRYCSLTVLPLVKLEDARALQLVALERCVENKPSLLLRGHNEVYSQITILSLQDQLVLLVR